jgi:hypothetical protein
MTSRFASILVAVVVLGTVEILAQSATPPQARTLAYVEGSVFLNDQRVEDPTVAVTLQMDSVVRTEQGRAEVVLDGGAVLFLGDRSAVRSIYDQFSKTSRTEVLAGSAILWTGGGRVAMECEDPVTLSEFGVYRFDFNPSTPRNIDDVCSFKVFGGAATLHLASLSPILKAGRQTGLNRHCGDMIQTHDFDTGPRDAFDRWSLDRMRLREGR